MADSPLGVGACGFSESLSIVIRSLSEARGGGIALDGGEAKGGYGVGCFTGAGGMGL